MKKYIKIVKDNPSFNLEMVKNKFILIENFNSITELKIDPKVLPLEFINHKGESIVISKIERF